MKLYYNFLLVLSIAILPLTMHSQEYNENPWDDSSDNWWEEYDDGCPIPCSEIFLNMEEIYYDESDDSGGDGDYSYSTTGDASVHACPSSKGMKISVKVSINAPTGAAAKDSLKKWQAKYEGTPAMTAALMKKFKCEECDELPGIGPCPQSVSNVKIFLGGATGSAGNYKATITVKFKANCGECPLLILQPGSNSNSLSNSSLSVFPNPSTHTINVNIELPDIKTEVQFRILDITGKLVKRINTTPTSQLHKQNIEILNLEDGMYFLECTQGDLLREVIQFTKIK